MYLDFSKAFDSVSHPELLVKLGRLGITGSLWMWFKEYLLNKQHLVEIDGRASSPLPVVSGVPQGSILGPMLFLVYINDLPERINFASCYLLADHAKLIAPITSSCDHLRFQEDLNSLHEWCSEWCLKLNSKKCCSLQISLSPHVPVTNRYHIDNVISSITPIVKRIWA